MVLRCLSKSTQVPTVSGFRYFVHSAEPAGGSADAAMVDERDTGTWPAVLQVSVRVALQVLCLRPWQGRWIMGAPATTDGGAGACLFCWCSVCEI